jgi:hypothetical protein
LDCSKQVIGLVRLKTTQQCSIRKIAPWGNSLLQSGTSIGAIITPLLMNMLMTNEAGSWRFTFQAIGVAGVVWIFFWLAFVRPNDLRGATATVPAGQTSAPAAASFWSVVFSRRILIVLITISLINTAWQLLRAWLPKFLIEGRGYLESDALNFNACSMWRPMSAVWAQAWRRSGFIGVHCPCTTRACWCSSACAALTALSVLLGFLPKGWLLLGVLLLVGAGALGLVPCYHALTQEISPTHQGKITGLAGVVAWAVGSPTHHFFGRLIDRTGSFDLGLAIAGGLPLAAFFFIWVLWNSPQARCDDECARNSKRLIPNSWHSQPNFGNHTSASGHDAGSHRSLQRQRPLPWLCRTFHSPRQVLLRHGLGESPCSPPRCESIRMHNTSSIAFSKVTVGGASIIARRSNSPASTWISFPTATSVAMRARRHKMKIYPTIEKRSRLAARNWPSMAWSSLPNMAVIRVRKRARHFIPVYEFFRRAMRVFESSGRAVPVFNDKHLSTNWNECVAMVRASQRLGFPFLAGSSLPVDAPNS